MQATVPMVSLARAMSDWSKSQIRLALGQVHDGLEPGVVAPLGEEERDHALLDEAQQQLAQRRPVEGVELLVAHEAVGAFVQRDEARSASGGIPGRLSGQSTATCTRRSQAASTLSGQAEHVDDDTLGAAESVAQDVEGSLGAAAGVAREAEARDLAHHREDDSCPRR